MMPSSKRIMREFSLFRFYCILAISVMYFIAQLVVAHISHSLVLQVDAYHMLYNILSLITCIVTIRASQRSRNTGMGARGDIEPVGLDQTGSERKASALKNTFGWTRIDVCGAVSNICFLSALCFSVVVDSLQSIFHASHHGSMSDPWTVLKVGCVGVAVNLICFVTIGGYTFHQSGFLCSDHALGDDVVISASIQSYVQQGIKSRRRQGLLECVRDTFGTFIVIICAILLIVFKKVDYLDPSLCIFVVIIMALLSYSYAKEACHVLLLTIPDHINVKTLLQELRKNFPEICNVHDFHVWQLTPARIIASAHVVLQNAQNYLAIHNNIVDFLHTKGISHVTLQPEFLELNASGESPGARRRKCFLPCDQDDCEEKQCCTSALSGSETHLHDDSGHSSRPESPDVVYIPEASKPEVVISDDTPTVEAELQPMINSVQNYRA